jgi:DNA-directed RNA polymerase specialized sigma24 family protein
MTPFRRDVQLACASARMESARHQHDEELARRVYSYFIFRLRQPEDAERLTRLSFERVWREENLRRDGEGESDLRVLATARAVIAENPRPRGAAKYVPAASEAGGGRIRLGDQLAMALGRLHGREREALALRFGAELSVGEIAELIDRTPAEVKQRLARGVRSLIGLGLLPKKEGRRRSAAKRSGSGRTEQGDAEKQEPGD